MRDTSSRNLNRLFTALVDEAGVRRMRVHDMRHTCASLHLAQGIPPRGVMEILGHSQISITMETYAHVMPTAMRDAADAIDAALGGWLEFRSGVPEGRCRSRSRT